MNLNINAPSFIGHYPAVIGEKPLAGYKSDSFINTLGNKQIDEQSLSNTKTLWKKIINFLI